MKEEKEWVPFQEIDWNDPNFNHFNVDTRDFHCGYRFEPKSHKDLSVLVKYPEFFYTEEELKETIQRLFNESGGKAKWRMLTVKGYENWQLKYLRIWRTDLGFIICNCEHYALKKSVLQLPVIQEHLGTH
jgi:hypothetical protein